MNKEKVLTVLRKITHCQKCKSCYKYCRFNPVKNLISDIELEDMILSEM